MRKIVLFNLISIDGYFAGIDGDISWHNVDDEFNEFAIEHTKTFGTIIFGRTTYKMFEEYWPKALIDPATSDADRQIAQTIDDMTKIVFSKTLTETTWNNSKIFHEINAEDIKAWKELEGKDAVIFGSGTIAKQLANLNQIDEYRLMVNPVILGEGKNMFENLGKKNLKLTDIKRFKNGNVLLTYLPA
ncbi:MAG: dihydrofolate reductase [Niabella sp.]|nr:MAG: dihydrofolate reductase [Niabella sp.]